MDDSTANILRHTFAITLVRGTDLVMAAEMAIQDWRPNRRCSLSSDDDEGAGQWAPDRRVVPTLETVAALILEMLPVEWDDAVMGSDLSMSEDAVRRYRSLPYVAICTDGFNQAWLAPCHPRSYGAFPKVLGEYKREKRALPLETTLRKMTRFPPRCWAWWTTEFCEWACAAMSWCSTRRPSGRTRRSTRPPPTASTSCSSTG
ncbi:hypothetical protein [Nonomuraea sp. NPDC049784]|uniref:hypothetical protein n=1 Tax=Nonomuraea sp. NPDC049784 TaxID=3154361 RepID=UPI0033FE6B45